MTEQTSRSSAQEIDTRFSRDCKNTNLFVERLFKTKNTDANVDAVRERTVRPVGGHQSHQLVETDIDYRVPGLPHAVEKQAENFRVREPREEDRESPRRQSLQRDLQQNKAYNPFSDVGNVELFELCETIPQSAMLRMPSLLESRHSLLHLWTSLERK